MKTDASEHGLESLIIKQMTSSGWSVSPSWHTDYWSFAVCGLAKGRWHPAMMVAASCREGFSTCVGANPEVVSVDSALRRTAAPSVLAPESALGSLLRVALSSAQAMGLSSPVAGARERLSRWPCFVVVALELPPGVDHAARGLWGPSHLACWLERGSRSPNAVDNFRQFRSSQAARLSTR